MTKRHIASLACAAALVGSGLGAAPPDTEPTTHRVHPGESIQQAVDAARYGDTVRLSPGTYRESVRITTSGLTLAGAGPSTVITPDTASRGNACAKAGTGICVEGQKGRTVDGTTISALTLSGFPRNGLWSSYTDRLTVTDVTAEKNGRWGLAQERSTHAVFLDNRARDNGDAGLFLANAVDTEEGAMDAQGTMIARNDLQGNHVGVTLRRLRNLTVADNELTANCAGLFAVGDENTPRTGALTVSDNHVYGNNKSCPKSKRLPAFQGVGIALTGTEDTLVTRNDITGNVGRSPFSGGVVLVKSMVGAPSARNRISGNVLRHNSPADLVNAAKGKNNVFQSNLCGTSTPAGLCRPAGPGTG
ncbi:right-handed parallel beta-helix repeat-containing protein [Streptomyces sp. NPDC002513]